MKRTIPFIVTTPIVKGTTHIADITIEGEYQYRDDNEELYASGDWMIDDMFNFDVSKVTMQRSMEDKQDITQAYRTDCIMDWGMSEVVADAVYAHIEGDYKPSTKITDQEFHDFVNMLSNHTEQSL